MRPILRWIGGKHRISQRLLELLPTKFNNYIEPMAGSAALFFAYKPQREILADKNEEIINFYSILANETDEFISESLKLKRLPHPSANNSVACQYGVEITAEPTPTAYESVPLVIWASFK